MNKLAWYFNRLKAMGPKEVLLRVREHGLKMTESKHFGRLQSVEVSELGKAKAFPQLPVREDLTESEVLALKDESKSIIDGHWHVLRGHELEVSFPPLWHRDYLCGKEVPDKAKIQAKNLDHRSLPEGIDPRIIWETSRWIQLVRLAQLAWYEKDHALAELIIETLDDWVKENPVGYGINWTSPMEPGIRLTNFTWIHAFLSDVGLPDEMERRLDIVATQIIPAHVWWVWRYHSVGTSANNHLLGEVCGLMVTLARWPEAEQWSVSFEKLTDLMTNELLLQFAKDGGNLEQALHYHLFAWEMGWQSILAMRFNNLSVGDTLMGRMGKAAHFFATVVSPQEPWDFGDSDDAHVTPVFSRDETCLAEWQAWFRGEEKGGFISHWFSEAPHREGSDKYGDWVFFPDSGYAIYEKKGLKLRLDGSPLGFGAMAAHGHLDALHLSIWYEGKALIIDPGTGSYFDNRDVRDYFLSAAAHNAPCLLGGEDYPVHAGPFLWAKHHADPEWKFENGVPTLSVIYRNAEIVRSVRVEGHEVIVTDKVTSIKDGNEMQTTWQASPKAENSKDGSIQREGVNLSCEIDGESLAFKKGEVKKQAGHCSEYFRSEQFSPFAQKRWDSSKEDLKQVTKFSINK